MLGGHLKSRQRGSSGTTNHCIPASWTPELEEWPADAAGQPYIVRGEAESSDESGKSVIACASAAAELSCISYALYLRSRMLPVSGSPCCRCWRLN